jgi:hypothetical protein
MPVVASDMKVYLTGGAGNTNPNASLGGVTSTTQMGTAIHSLFDVVSPDESEAGDIEYRAVSLKNMSADTAYSVYAYIVDTSSADTSLAIAYDSVGTQSIVNESTAPTAVSFSAPTTRAAGIALGDMAAGAARRIWVRWTVDTAAAATAADTASFKFDFGST